MIGTVKIGPQDGQMTHDARSGLRGHANEDGPKIHVLRRGETSIMIQSPSQRDLRGVTSELLRQGPHRR